MTYQQDYDFYILINDLGKRSTCFNFHPQHLQKLNYLSGQPEFNSSEEVKKIIGNIENVVNGSIEKYFIGAEDALDLKINKYKVIANDLIQFFGYDRTDITEINTIDFLDFLKNWESFILKVENNQIPNTIFK